MTGLILFSVYFISVLRMRRWIRIAHSESGRWFGLTPDLRDVVATFTPVLNTIFTIVCFFRSPCRRMYFNYSMNYNKIFGIKNK